MATKKKMLQAAAGNAGGAALDITDVFSTYLYTGNEATQTITNGIDLDGEGGMVWIKRRNLAERHAVFDNERGLDSALATDEDSQARIRSGWMSSFNADGFTLNTGDTELNNNGDDYASWTFRKAPKFFDVVTYTGDGTNGRAISHNLGSTPGCIFIKCTAGDSRPWAVYHRGTDATSPQNYYLQLNETSARVSDFYRFSNTAPTDAAFTVASSNDTNGNGNTYVAYLFAHNDGDGEFGPDGDQDIIKCGSYTGNGGANTIDLGFEPQWVMIKRSSGTGFWHLFDTMRGMPSGSNNQGLTANTSNAEGEAYKVNPTATGFEIQNETTTEVNANGSNYIYMAIRRGPLAQPESATEVFDITSFSSSEASTTNRPDVLLWRQSLTSSSSNEITSRLTAGKILATDLTSAEYDASGTYAVDLLNDGIKLGSSWGNFPWALSWTRAPGFFDVVAYTGDGVAGRTVSHNLGVAPEMMWVKSRTEVYSWEVYHEALGNRAYLALEETSAAQINTPDSWNNTSPTDTNFTLGASWFGNKSNGDYIAYLFATVPGVSKVGSYTGNGSSQTIDCGFTSGARFVLIKRTDSTGSWVVYDTERGIVSGNDAALLLQSSGAEYSGADEIDPNSSGFDVVHDANGFLTNASGASYIFYAIA